MKIKKVEINNFRLLKKLSVDMTDMMLLVGKNNSGKTSFFEVFDLFLDSKKFTLADFSKGLITKKRINKLYEEFEKIEEKSQIKIEEIKCKFPTIDLNITLDLSKVSDFSSIKPLIYEFENNDEIILASKYQIDDLVKIVDDYKAYNSKILDLKKISIDFFDFFVEYYNNYFIVVHYTTKKEQGTFSPLISHTKIKDLFTINVIKAKRDVDDTSDQNKQGISSSLWKHYLVSNEVELENKHLFLEQTNDIKNVLENQYIQIFEDVLKSIREDLFIDDTKIKVSANIDVENMLKTNAKLRYLMDDLELNEASNGLGISNLIYILLEIYHFNYISRINNKPFNILFIEEPEAHLHPQMQLTLYNKLESVLKNDNQKNVILSTHSSHLISISEFNTINYFYKDKKEQVYIKSLEKFIEENKMFETFLRKYFEINLTDLFFADKSILYEGASERLLFPTFLKKYDKKHESKLSNQHISFFEVGGRYAHVFYKLLEYLGMKSLIVADIDSVKNRERVTCNIKDDIDTNTYTIKTSNGVIKNWFDMMGKNLFVADLVQKDLKEFTRNKAEYNMYLATQLPRNSESHCGRTLEEELIIHNADKIVDDFNNKIEDESYKLKFNLLFKLFNVEDTVDRQFILDNSFDVVNKINKTEFALDLIEIFEHWDIPDYIEEGLKWLER